MRRFLKYFICLFIVIGNFTTVSAASSISYSYYDEIISKTDWDNMSRSERIAYCQLSKDTLNKISTNNLLNIVLDYPFIIDVYAFDNIDYGIDLVKNQYNGLEELLSRDDLDEVLLNHASIASYSLNDYNTIFTNNCFTYLLSSDTLKSVLSTQEQVEIETKILKNKTKSNATAYANTFSQANQLSGGISTFATATVKTPKGSSITVINNQSIADFSSTEKSSLDKKMKQAYPSITLVSAATKKYNCHSYTWYSQSTSNYYWINDPSKYMTDKSYSKTDISVGVKVYHTDNSHSAIVTSVGSGNMLSLKYKSKWGQCGVYIYYASESPYTSSQTFWTR